MNDEYVFSLDIGTRTVIGVVGKYEGDVLKILGSEKVEHKKRAMYDGQIHDINSVAEVADTVKKSLEEQTGIDIKRVSIAAAGRSLKTVKSKVTVSTDISREIEKRDIKSAELEAIQIAQKTLDKETEEKNKYHCVGYSLIRSYLDDVLIENLEGHRGEEITMEVIATFLPYTVMNSLYSVMDRVGLEVANITLEPIAAMEVAIKQNLRLLNLALVDVGAGTSDIAITRDGAIYSYDMVPTAGDEITEAIVNRYLLDYDEAEKLKLGLKAKDMLEYTDIMGIGHEKGKDEILDEISDSIECLADEIATRIMSINGKTPSAVFLIGGGCQIPKLDSYIAEKLELPKERVAVRDAGIIENVEGMDENLEGSDGITPIGIAVNSAKSNYRNFIEVNVNGQNVKLFNSGSPKILDIMLTIGYNPRNLVPERGASTTYFLNGEKHTAIGETGESAEIISNGKLVDMEFPLKDGDEIIIKSATKGKDAEVKLRDIVDLGKKVTVNDKIKNEDYTVTDGDNIYIEVAERLEDIVDIEFAPLEKVDKIQEQEEEKKISIVLNGEHKTIVYNKQSFKFVDIFDYIDFDTSKPKGTLNLKVNGERAEYMKDVEDGDVIEIRWSDSE